MAAQTHAIVEHPTYLLSNEAELLANDHSLSIVGRSCIFKLSAKDERAAHSTAFNLQNNLVEARGDRDHEKLLDQLTYTLEQEDLILLGTKP